MLPDVAMHGLGVPDRKLSALRGKPLLINVWASWCGPCREEIGSLNRLAHRHVPKDFNVIGVSTDDLQDHALWFIRNARINFPSYLDSHLQLENILGADHLPLTLLVDAKGKVLEKFTGGMDWDGPEAEERLAKYFGKLKPSR